MIHIHYDAQATEGAGGGKLTRGEKNELIRQKWTKRQEEIEKLMGVSIVKTAGGIEPSYSYRPGGEAFGYESPESVVIDLENKYMMANLTKL